MSCGRTAAGGPLRFVLGNHAGRNGAQAQGSLLPRATPADGFVAPLTTLGEMDDLYLVTANLDGAEPH
jgi:hypothetical protein